jgi:hypothetical protein
MTCGTLLPAALEDWTQRAFQIGSVLRVCAASLESEMFVDQDAEALRSTIETAERMTTDLMGQMMEHTEGKAG